MVLLLLIVNAGITADMVAYVYTLPEFDISDFADDPQPGILYQLAESYMNDTTLASLFAETSSALTAVGSMRSIAFWRNVPKLLAFLGNSMPNSLNCSYFATCPRHGNQGNVVISRSEVTCIAFLSVVYT